MERLNEKHEGESPKVTLRMDPSMIKVVDREAKRIDGTRSAALRSLVMRATGAGVTAAVGGAMVAQAEVSEIKARLEKAENLLEGARADRDKLKRESARGAEDYRKLNAELKETERARDKAREDLDAAVARVGAAIEARDAAKQERDEAIAQRKEADHGAKKTMEAWNQVRKDLDAARTRVIAVTDAHDKMARERDAAIAEVARLKTELEQERKVSEGRREMLLKKSDELRAEWLRAERTEGEVSRLKAELDALKSAAIKTAHKIIAETPAEVAEVAEVVREAEQPAQTKPSITTLNSPRYKNDALRARYRALNTSLRPFVAKHGITRTPFQKWVAGERDMHGETLAKYEAAIKSEE